MQVISDGASIEDGQDATTAGVLIGEPLVYRSAAGARAQPHPVAEFQFLRTERIRIEWPALRPSIRRRSACCGARERQSMSTPVVTEREDHGRKVLSCELPLSILGASEYLIDIVAQRGEGRSGKWSRSGWCNERVKAEGTRHKAEVWNTCFACHRSVRRKMTTRQRVPHFCLVPSAFCLVRSSDPAQTPPQTPPQTPAPVPPPGPLPQFRAGVDIFQLEVSVLNSQGQPVAGLHSADFTVMENGKPQPIVDFQEIEFPEYDGPQPESKEENAPDVTNKDFADRRLTAIVLDDWGWPQERECVPKEPLAHGNGEAGGPAHRRQPG